jgi:TonB family protein
MVKKFQSELKPVALRRAGIRIFQAAALALIFVLTVPAGAASQRAIKSRKQPVYPELAKRLKIAGEVKLEAVVDAQGKVKAVKTVSGTQILAQAAEDAVWSWVFVPGDGDSTVDLSFSFGAGQ